MIKINNIISDSIVDGPGLRTTIFFQGCQRHCPGCHNPQTWNESEGVSVTIEELLAAIKSRGSQNLTLSGGEPLLQAEEIEKLIDKYRKLYSDNNIWLWTGAKIDDIFKGKDYAGCNSEAAKRILCKVDYIVDGKFILEKRDITLNWRGSSNQRVIKVNNPASKDKVIWIQKDTSFNDVTKGGE